MILDEIEESCAKHSCLDDPDSCCEDYYCDLSTRQYGFAKCVRSPDACFLQNTYCGEYADQCCDGLTCHGEGVGRTCQPENQA